MSETIKENRVVPMVSLFPHPRNYRQHPPQQITNLKKSLERFGQGRSIVVQEHENGSYTIVAGHGIYQAADELGYKELRADILPKDWTEAQVQGYLVADNLHSADATDDDELLAHLLQEQKDAGYDLAALGSSDETLRQMLAELGDEYVEAGEGEEAIPGIDAPDLPYKNQFAVAVICESESQQQQVFEALQKQGYTCKVLVV